MGLISKTSKRQHLELKLSLTRMEILIYGTFLVLSLLAYIARHVASAGDAKKINVSNSQFKSFQRSFYLVYFCALLGDWLQGPYVYKLCILWLQRVTNCSVIRCGIRFQCSFRNVYGSFGGYLGKKKDGNFLFCDLHILLSHQAVSQLLVAFYRPDIWWYCYV